MVSDPLADAADCAQLDIRAILKACAELPPAVISAEYTYIKERIVDRDLLESLTGESAFPTGTSDWPNRRKRRRQALSRYLDKLLICVFIRLPGVHYTIEIDPEIDRVIHWEWQPI